MVVIAQIIAAKATNNTTLINIGSRPSKQSQNSRSEIGTLRLVTNIPKWTQIMSGSNKAVPAHPILGF